MLHEAGSLYGRARPLCGRLERRLQAEGALLTELPREERSIRRCGIPECAREDIAKEC